MPAPDPRDTARSPGAGAAELQRVAVDAVALARGDAGEVLLLAAQRDHEPHAGLWALPGGLLRPDEDLDGAARRVLARVGVEEPRHLEQLASFGAPERDPRGRVVSVSHLALLPQPAAVATHAAWWPLDQPPQLAFDHADIVSAAVARLRGKLSYSNVAYGLLPPAFTLTELQEVYEAVLARPLDKRNFRKKVLAMGLLEEAEGQRRGQHRPAQLHRFAAAELVLFDDVIAATA